MDECCKEMVKWPYEFCEQEIREEMERKYGARIRNLEQQLQEKRVTEVRFEELEQPIEAVETKWRRWFGSLAKREVQDRRRINEIEAEIDRLH